jgi:hypothetical protein
VRGAESFALAAACGCTPFLYVFRVHVRSEPGGSSLGPACQKFPSNLSWLSRGQACPAFRKNFKKNLSNVRI